VDAYKHFADPEWDGEPIEVEDDQDGYKSPLTPQEEQAEPESIEEVKTTLTGGRKKVKIKLRDGKEREIQHMISTSFWNADGKPISAEEFLNGLFGTLPDFFKNEDELRTLWSKPDTRKKFLEQLTVIGYGCDELFNLQKLMNAENSDLFDVLEYVFNSETKPITRADRVEIAKLKIYTIFDEKQREFINFVLDKYIESGVEELNQEKLPVLLELKYNSLSEAQRVRLKISDLCLQIFSNIYTGKISGKAYKKNYISYCYS
jgi:type I restriction enzyme R subunit